MKREPTDWEKTFAIRNQSPKFTAYQAYQHQYKQPTQKMGRPEQTFLQRGHTDSQEAHEKMFNITSY